MEKERRESQRDRNPNEKWGTRLKDRSAEEKRAAAGAGGGGGRRVDGAFY